MHCVKQAQRLDRAVTQVAAVGLKRHDTPYVDVAEVERGTAIEDPLREHLADAAARCDADGIESGRDEEVAHLGSLAKVIAVIGREALGPVEEELDAGCGECRHAPHRRLEDGLEVLRVLGE